MINPSSERDSGTSLFSTNALPPAESSIGVPPSLRRGAGVGAFLLAIATAGALAHVGVRLKGLEVAYDLGRERRIATDLEEQRRRLQIEIGMLKDPRRVVAIARDKLKMGPPNPEAIRRLGSGELWAATDLPPPSASTKNQSSAPKKKIRAHRPDTSTEANVSAP